MRDKTLQDIKNDINMDSKKSSIIFGRRNIIKNKTIMKKVKTFKKKNTNNDDNISSFTKTIRYNKCYNKCHNKCQGKEKTQTRRKKSVKKQKQQQQKQQQQQQQQQQQKQQQKQQQQQQQIKPNPIEESENTLLNLAKKMLGFYTFSHLKRPL